MSLSLDTPFTPSKKKTSAPLSPTTIEHQKAIAHLLEHTMYQFDNARSEAGDDNGNGDGMLVNSNGSSDSEQGGNGDSKADNPSNVGDNNDPENGPGDTDGNDDGADGNDDGENRPGDADGNDDGVDDGNHNGENEPGMEHDDDNNEEVEKNEKLDTLIAERALPLWLSKAFKRHVAVNPGKPLTTAGRPVVLSDWIHNGCQPDRHHRLSKDVLEVMCNELFTWWFSIQPQDRIPADFDESSQDCSELICIPFDDPEIWSEVYHGGAGSIYGVLVCIGWWLEANDSPGTKFDSLVEDFCWVMENLLQFPVPPAKPKAKKPPSCRH
ncbi:hypothetical protein BDN71DRAFT_1505513 [Pleurotus eryngii]|uniref:Uncharacterized protein n=1 Tax=Pleurotus eryngii TaxID=5323 RepID=A0A9P5ZYI1_PLEER|nr:hypothetical protein BDN71DRAFT_1505513 [Pleurotus eryngii]